MFLEAERLILRHSREEDFADCIHCGYFDCNIPSRELQKKLGFTCLTTVQLGEGRTGIENILWRE